MEREIKENVKTVLLFIFIGAFIWVSISNVIQAFKCPEMSQTELLLHIPRSFIADFRSC